MAAGSTAGPARHPVHWGSAAEVKTVGKELYGEIKKDRVTTLAAAFAYHTVFAIPALIILTITIAALVDRATSIQVSEHLRQLIQDRAPADTRSLLNSIVDNAVAKVGGGGISVGIIITALLALWSGSNAVGALIESFNRAYDVDEDRPFIKKKGVTLGLTLLLAIFINLSFVLLVFGQRIGHWIASQAGLGSAFDTTWNLLRWPIAVILVSLILAVLYYAGPNVEQSFRWISPGSIVATILWLLATGLIGIYLSISNPGNAYGALGSILVLLFYLYVTGIIFLLGAELNALVAERNDPKTIRDVQTSAKAQPEARARASQGQGARRHSA